MNKKRALSYALGLALVVGLFVLIQVLINSGTLSGYYEKVIILICINITLAVSLNLVTGILGQLVLGHAAFMAVGAYTAAIFTNKMTSLPIETSFPISLVMAGLVTAVVGIIIGIPALRLHGDYLAIITLGFGFIIQTIFENLPSSFVPNGGKLSVDIVTTFSTVFIVMVLTIFVTYTLGTSRHGRGIVSIREDEIASEASGINITYYKMLAFVISALLAGVAGGLFAHNIGYIEPSNFDFNYSVNILIMVVLGGMGSITGAVIASTFLTVLNEVLGDVFANIASSSAMVERLSAARTLTYAIILIAVMLFKPSGLLGRKEFSLTKVINFLTGKNKKDKKDKNKGGA